MSQTVFPTGTTIYDPDKCYNGYTLYPSKTEAGAILIDMNGNVVKNWPQFTAYMINMLPGGHILGGQVGRLTKKYDFKTGADDLVQEDWEGNVVWKYGKATQLEVDGELEWSARVNHDIVREGCPVGYYVPGMKPKIRNGKNLFLSYERGSWPEVTRDYLPRATRIVEISWDGNILWDWMPAEHFEEFGHSEAAKNAIMRCCRNQHCVFQNTVSYVGPNKWYDAGDERFHPDNVITDDRGTILYIVSRDTKKIVWKVGPDYTATPALQALEPIIGPHHTHMIPRGLPGEGNILVFDNGGAGGFGPPNPGAPDGTWNALRDSSRVLEIDPVTLRIVWEYTARTAGYEPFGEDVRFYSRYESSAQRLPNGNTLITESKYGRLFEVTPECDIVWEYISPYSRSRNVFSSDVFRSYRYPYDWLEQCEKPTQKAVIPPNNFEFRIKAVGE